MQRFAQKTLFLTFIFSNLALTTAMAHPINPMKLDIQYRDANYWTEGDPVLTVGKASRILFTGVSPYNNNPKPNFNFKINDLPDYITLNSSFLTKEGQWVAVLTPRYIPSIDATQGRASINLSVTLTDQDLRDAELSEELDINPSYTKSDLSFTLAAQPINIWFDSNVVNAVDYSRSTTFVNYLNASFNTLPKTGNAEWSVTHGTVQTSQTINAPNLGVDFSLSSQNGTPPVGGNASAYQTVTIDPTTAQTNYVTPVSGDWSAITAEVNYYLDQGQTQLYAYGSKSADVIFLQGDSPD